MAYSVAMEPTEDAPPIRLIGRCDASRLWQEVSTTVSEWFQSCPAWATRWTMVVRPKTEADDRMLVEDGETDDPASCWAVAIDAEAFRVTVAVPAEADKNIIAANAAGFLVELLVTVADPAAD